MGAWGAGNFENDDALDLLGELAADTCVSRLGEIFDAAAPAFREPNVGRKLRAAFRRAGLDSVEVDVAAAVDTDGRLRTVVENMLGYGLRFGRIERERASELLDRLDRAIAEGSFLAVLPQWWVRGTKPT